jgi:hypothetical protein
MVQCWCHAAMAGWLGASEAQGAAQTRVRRWQYECERAGGDCAARVEAIALRMPYSRAVRTGPSLRIHATSGTVEFQDAAGRQPMLFRYLGFLEPLRRHLVWRRSEDGVRFLTLGEDDGQQAVFESLSQTQGLQPSHATGPVATA